MPCGIHLTASSYEEYKCWTDIILVAEEAGSGEGINELADIFGGRFMGDLVATL